MSAAPVVQNLNDIIATVGQGVAGQKAQFDSEIAQNETAGAAQVAGINAAKDQAFGDITQESQNKGMFFSGFSPDAQARYTAATYLPALAKLQATIASTRNNLLMGKNALDTTVFNTAYGTQQNEVGALNTYNNQQDQFAHEDSTLEKTQAFQAQQAAADRAATAANEAANRAASAASSKPTASEEAAASKLALSSDIAAYFNDPKAKTAGYTERTILPSLYQAYGDVGNNTINQEVYQYRKNALGF